MTDKAVVFKDISQAATIMGYEYSAEKIIDMVIATDVYGFLFLKDIEAADTALLTVSDTELTFFGVALSMQEKALLTEHAVDLSRLPNATYVVGGKTGEILLDHSNRKPEYKHWGTLPVFPKDHRSVLTYDMSNDKLTRIYSTDHTASLLYGLHWVSRNMINAGVSSTPSLSVHGLKTTLNLMYRQLGLEPYNLSDMDARVAVGKLKLTREPLPDKHFGEFTRIFYQAFQETDAKGKTETEVIGASHQLPASSGGRPPKVPLSELIVDTFVSKVGDPDPLEIDFDVPLGEFSAYVSHGYCRDSMIYFEIHGNTLSTFVMETISQMFPDPDQIVFTSKDGVVKPLDSEDDDFDDYYPGVQSGRIM